MITLLGVLQYSKITNRKGTQIWDGKKIYFIITFFSVTLVEGLRSINVGEDLRAYVSWFYYYQGTKFGLENLYDFSSFEPGFILLSKAIGKIALSPQCFIMCTSIIIVFLNLTLLYKSSKDFYLSILLFFGFNHFFTSMVSLRQYIAIGFVVWVFILLNEKKYKFALIMCIVALYFHQSSAIFSIVVLAAHFLKRYRKSIPWIFGLSIVSILFINQLYDFVSSFFVKYSTNYQMSTGGMIGKLRLIYIFLEIILLFIIYFSRKYQDDKYTEYSILIIPSIFCGLLTSVPWAFRIGYYFDYILLLLIPEMVVDEKVNRKAFRIATIIVSIIFFLYYLSSNPGQTVPYEFYK